MRNTVQHTNIIALLQKYIENECNEHELFVLLHWIKLSENHNDFNSVSDSLWNKLDGKFTYPNNKQIENIDREADILLKKIKFGQVSSLKKITIRQNPIFRYASIILILLSLSMGYIWLHNTYITKETTYSEVNVSRGEIKEHTLVDGTHIILNSGSKLRIPSDYNEKNRNIEIVGEAFFDVAPNPDKPFIITSGKTQVKVLGTSFNVKAYSEDNSIGVTVSTGKVLVSIPDIDLQLRVLPMEHLLVNKETSDITKLTLAENNYTRWVEGVLYFDKEPLKEVIKTISRKYEKTVQLRCQNCNPLISGRHDNKSLKAVIDAICFTTGLKSKEEGEYIILYQ